MFVSVVIEVFYGDEGNPSVEVYSDHELATQVAQQKRKENDEGGPNRDVLVILKRIEVDVAEISHKVFEAESDE